jgi:hypothetical protein
MAESYKILSQVQDTELNTSGTGFIQVWKVTYQVTSGPAKGTVGTVSFPEAEHTSDIVSATIADKVAQLTDVASLTS